MYKYNLTNRNLGGIIVLRFNKIFLRVEKNQKTLSKNLRLVYCQAFLNCKLLIGIFILL